MITIHARDLARNSFSKQHRNPNPQRADHTLPTTSGAASCLHSWADTDWHAVIDGCRNLLAIAFGVNASKRGYRGHV
jgi:hypothetical protein